MDGFLYFGCAGLVVEDAGDASDFAGAGVVAEAFVGEDEEPGEEICGEDGDGGGAGDVGLVVLGEEAGGGLGEVEEAGAHGLGGWLWHAFSPYFYFRGVVPNF